MTMLRLRLKKKWYDMIDSGEKKEEYREIKPYWWARVFTSPYHKMGGQEALDNLAEGGYDQKHYLAHFKLGYQKNAPEMIWRLNFCTIGHAKPEWAENEMGKMIVIPLRDRLSEKALSFYNSQKENKNGFVPMGEDGQKIIDELLMFKLIKSNGVLDMPLYYINK